MRKLNDGALLRHADSVRGYPGQGNYSAHGVEGERHAEGELRRIGEAEIDRGERGVAQDAEEGVGDQVLGADSAPHALADPADESVFARPARR